MSLGGLLKAQASPVAIDFGVSCMKALQIAPGDPPSLIAAHRIETPDELIDDPEGRLAFQVGALPNLFKEGGFRGKRAVCSVSATATLVQHVFIPKGGGVEAGIREQARVLTGRDPSQLILRHVEVAEASRGEHKGVECICIAIPREIVLRYMQALRKCRMETVGVHSEHLAAARCFADPHHRTEGDEPAASLYADIGYATTKVVVAKGAKLLTARTLPIGGRDIDAAAAKRSRSSIAEARLARCALADASPDGRPVIGGRPFEDLPADEAGAQPSGPDPAERFGVIIADELALAVRYHRALFPGAPVDRCVFIGGEARAMAPCRRIARSIGLRSLVADPLRRLDGKASATVAGLDADDLQPGWVVPLGMCLAPTDL